MPFRFAIAGGSLALLLACSPRVTQQTGRVLQFDYATQFEQEQLDDDDNEKDILAVIDDDPDASSVPQGEGTVLLLEGRWREERIRLWISLQRSFGPGQSIEFEKEGFAQVVIGDPPTYVSNQVRGEVYFHEGGSWLVVNAEAQDPSIDSEWKETRRFRFEVDVNSEQFVKTSENVRPEALGPEQHEAKILQNADVEALQPGTRIQSRVRLPLVWGGAGAALGAYVGPLILMSRVEDGEQFRIPLAGPFLFLAAIKDRPDVDALTFASVAFVLGGMGVVQVAGLTALVAGTTWREKRVVRNGASLSVTPLVTQTIQGLGFTGSF